MTIREAEERTGLTRANIRYYEQEGLLQPKREPNGYRDYELRNNVTYSGYEQASKLRRAVGSPPYGVRKKHSARGRCSPIRRGDL